MTQDFLNDFLNGLGKRGRKSALEHLRHIVQNTPEVVVKVSGFTYDFAHLKRHFAYISRQGNLSLENEQGYDFRDRSEIDNLLTHWEKSHRQASLGQAERYRCSASLVFSMPAETDEICLKNAVRDFAKKTFKDYRYAMVLHEDSDHPHVHLCIHMWGKHQKKLHIKQGDPQKWREGFALALEEQGISAEATPRKVRGIMLKTISQAMLHLKARGVKLEQEKAMISDLKALWQKSVKSSEGIEGQGSVKNQGQGQGEEIDISWEENIRKMQKNMRQSWQKIAETYREKDPKLSQMITDFVEKMPPAATKRELLQQKIFHSIRDITIAQKLYRDHPELEAEILKILMAEQYIKQTSQDSLMQEKFMHNLIEGMSQKRLSGMTETLPKISDKATAQKFDHVQNILRGGGEFESKKSITGQGDIDHNVPSKKSHSRENIQEKKQDQEEERE